MTLTILSDPISLIRRRPDMYISLQVPLKRALLSRLLGDLIALEIPSFHVQSVNDWTLVGSPVDWLRRGKFLKERPLALFDGPMPFPEAGVNSCRSEAVIRALSEKTVVWTPSECSFLDASGSAKEDSEIAAKCKEMQLARAVGFLVTDAIDAYGLKAFEFLLPWYRDERPEVLLELQRELSPGHALHGKALKILARCGASDDYLFAADDGTGLLAKVHLTWSQRPETPPWPKAEMFSSVSAWMEAMRGDHDAHGY